MSTAPPPTDLPRDPRRWLVLAVMSVGTLIVFLDGTVINTALPNISTKLSATTSQLQWVVDSYILVLAGLLLLGGTLGDRFGRRRWMSVGLVIFAGGSLLGGLSGSIETLIAARAVQGLGAALVLPATLSIVTNVFQRDERAKAIAIWTAVSGLGVGIGPAVGGYLVEQWDYTAAFWIHLPILGLAGVGMVFVAESRDHRQVGLDVPGALTGTVAVASLVYAIIQGGEAGWTDPQILFALAISATSFLAFIVIERRAAHPMLPLRFFRQRDFTGSVVSLGIVFFAGIVLFFFLSQYWQLVQGRSPLRAGLMALPNAGAIIAGSAVAQSLLSKVGPRRLVSTAMVIMGTGVALFTTIDAGTSTVRMIGTLMVVGFGFGLASQPLTDTVMAAVPIEDAGVGSAVNDVSRELGSALGVAIIGSIVSHLYRSGVDDNLAGQVPADVVEIAREGIGVTHVAAQSLEPLDAATVIDGANSAFIDAITTGFWVSVGFVALGLAISLFLLPKDVRLEQVVRADDDEPGEVDAPHRAPVALQTEMALSSTTQNQRAIASSRLASSSPAQTT
jgi:EmrB/QacA subfamily drug resistance transporter